MADIDKTKFIQTYGIDDDNFITYLNKFKTLKKIIGMERLDVIPKESVRHLYNRFIYYNSLGHNLNTIVDETTSDIRSLFFFNEHGYFEYDLPAYDTANMSNNYSKVVISGRVCQIKIVFKAIKEINSDDIIFDLVPAPFIDQRFVLWNRKTKTSLSLIIDDDGIKLNEDTIPVDTPIAGTITYIIKK